MSETCRPISLSDGAVAWVDTEDHASVAPYAWNAGVRGGYATRKDHDCRTVYMHSQITGLPFVDHKNGNSLDNRRCNLRPANKSTNGANRGKPRGEYYSRYKGVSWNKRVGKWIAQIMVNYENISLGYYNDEKIAAKMYDAAAARYFGEYAQVNEYRDGE